MRVAHLSLADYRNYTSAEVSLDAGRNLLIGRNGQGKTNLVEAIGYFTALKSHRVSADAPLIRAGAESAIVRMKVVSGERDALLELQLNRDRPNRAQVNRNAVRPRELTRWFSSVLFAPEDLWIVRGDPSVRRRFLDEALASADPTMPGVLADYERVVRQRTSLLKSARHSTKNRSLEATLSVWDDQLIEYGSRIMAARRLLASRLRGPVGQSYFSLVDQDHRPKVDLRESVAGALARFVSRETTSGVSAVGVSRETIAEEYREALEAVRDQELERAVTLVGPHRDDLELELNDLPVKGYASHGESWSFVLSARLAVAEVLRQDSPAGDPVIILDDVFAELDRQRRERLMRAVSDFEQVIVTAAVEEDVPGDGAWHRVVISDGRVVDGAAEGVREDEARGAEGALEIDDEAHGNGSESRPGVLGAEPLDEEIPDHIGDTER